MPLYVYECAECGRQFEERHTIDDRNAVDCVYCTGRVSIVIQKVGVICKEYFDSELGTQITGPRQRERILRERGLIDIGDTRPENIKPPDRLDEELNRPENVRKFNEIYQEVTA